jgi:putative Mg2+ transporter-C (MgtC) family protein
VNEWDVVVRTLAALVAGGVIGLERSYHGRAAGLRTYALVSFGSALLVAGAEYELFATAGGDGGDVTRVIQGIVTGIGFLGAGVIVKDGFTVRGLTTAASIWVASAIGIVIGAGSYVPGIAASAVTLIALALLRRLEDRLPTQTFVHVEVAFERARAMDETQLRELIERHGFALREVSYRLRHEAQLLEYQTVIWSTNPEGASMLEQTLLAHPDVAYFRIAPGRD